MKKSRLVVYLVCVVLLPIMGPIPFSPLKAHAKQSFVSNNLVIADQIAPTDKVGAVVHSATSSSSAGSASKPSKPSEPSEPYDPLPSWSQTKTKERIIRFVQDVTDPSSKLFVPAAERLATFDNDGTILCEKPTFFEAIYCRDHCRAIQDKHPEWANNEAVQKFLKADDDHIGAVSGTLAITTNAEAAAGASDEAMRDAALQWLDTAKHPRFNALYKKLYYPPMIELVNYLKANDFKVYLCSGGQAYFMRCYVGAEYGIAPPQVIGSSLELAYTLKDGRSEIDYQPKMQTFNVGAVKPVSISQHLGVRPLIACGNSDGDLQMLNYTFDRKGPSLSMLIHHDDADREYLYDHGAEKVLPLAAEKGWLVVSMKDDFKKVFAFDKQLGTISGATDRIADEQWLKQRKNVTIAKQYDAELNKKIENLWMAREDGDCDLIFDLLPSGKITAPQTHGDSGDSKTTSSVFVASAIKAVKDAQPLPAQPQQFRAFTNAYCRFSFHNGIKKVDVSFFRPFDSKAK